MKHYVYIIQSEMDGSYYAGSAHNVPLRVHRHNEGWTKSTKGKRPWKLVYVKEFDTKTEPLRFERYIKKMKSRAFIEKLIRDAVPPKSGGISA
ncbi:MAG: GIY-YIG nuclease family protein [Bacteroidota bacterium]